MIEVRECEGGSTFLVRVQPRASRNEIDGEWQGALRIRLNVPPVEGRANEALRRILADCLNVPLGAVKIASGQRSRGPRHAPPLRMLGWGSRLKRVEVLGARAEQIRAVASSEARKGHSDR